MSQAARRAYPRSSRFLGRILKDRTGNVLPLVAAGTLVLSGLVGGGVDMGRAYMTERRLQAACDAGALAGRRAVLTNGFDSTALTQANQYFAANFDKVAQQTPDAQFTATSPDSGNTVNGTATATLDTVIMRIFGFDELDLSVTCSASMGVGNSDIMFVLDNTGSMLWAPDGRTYGVDADETRIYALRQAMKAFYDTVAASVAGSNARIRYGFVPYSSAVNVGELLYDLDPDYLADEISVQSVRFVNWDPVPIRSWSSEGFTYSSVDRDRGPLYSDEEYDDDDDCEDDLPAIASEWTDDGEPILTDVTYSVESDTGNQIKTTGVHQRQTRVTFQCRNEGSKRNPEYYIYEYEESRYERSSMYEERAPVPVETHNATFADAVLQRRTIDTSTYKTLASTTVPVGVRNYGRNTDFDNTATWEGCIMERQTTAASTFSFVSLLTGITPGLALDLDIDLVPTDDVATQWGPLWPEVTYSHNRNALFEAVDRDGSGIDEDELDDEEVSTYCPSKSQLLSEMNEDGFDDYVDSLIAVGSTYHDIGLLWGARLSSTTGIFADNVNDEAGNGGTVARHLVFMTDGELAPSLTVNSSYGLERLDMRITGNGDSDDQWANHRSRFLAICEAIKARGVRLWVIAFGTALTTDLSTCSSPSSSFAASDADQLNANFQEIANQVGELRIVQ